MSILDRFLEDSANEKEIYDFLRTLSNIEVNGNRLYDGSGTHFMQNPMEFTRLLCLLKYVRQNKLINFDKFLEFGWSAGIAHTILYKFLCPLESVAVDFVLPTGISTNTFFANLRFKNLTFIANDSTSKFTHDKVNSLGPFDFIFIDGGHDYSTVKSDFELALSVSSLNSIIALHDIHSVKPVEVSRLWKEIVESNDYETLEIFDNSSKIKYGIGIINLNQNGLLTEFQQNYKINL